MNSTHVMIKLLLSLLKQFGVRQIVLSSGSRNIPFVHAVEADGFFTCYSVVDERNAAFFALGLYQQSGQPVALACTSGTAVSNYLSGITEAFYSHAQLIAITFDRSPYALDQLETQKIDQTTMFRGVCKKSVSLPVLKDEDDIWYSGRLINEALIALEQHGTGPVQINVPLMGNNNSFYAPDNTEIPAQVRRIAYLPAGRPERWEAQGKKLLAAGKILVVMGQCRPPSEALQAAVRRFCKAAHCPVLCDHLANFRCEESILAEAPIKALNAETIKGFIPDIVITFGANFQERIKELLRPHRKDFEHWAIEPEGTVKDVFKSEAALFECAPECFFAYYAQRLEKACRDSLYLQKWKRLENAIELPEMPFTSFYVAREFSGMIPNNSILHLSILNSTRLFQFFRLDGSVTVYSNVNAFGIDGCLPTFMGQAAAAECPAFLVIGDLSFFYGMNALGICHRKNNIRILLLNNYGGAEFYFQPNDQAVPASDRYTGAVHGQTARGWAKSLGYRYLTANDKSTLNAALPEFVKRESDAPVLLEVFTDRKQDAQFCLSVYRHAEQCIRPSFP